jgi:hypothetical protein
MGFPYGNTLIEIQIPALRIGAASFLSAIAIKKIEQIA